MNHPDYSAGGPIALLCMIAGTALVAAARGGLLAAGATMCLWALVIIWGTR